MSQSESAERFTGLAEIYAAHRPDYPGEVMNALGKRALQAGGPQVALDIGCGTGISTMALAEVLEGWRIIGAEPNADMRAKATVTCAARPNIEFIADGAEAISLDDGAAGVVMAAQALHWFDAPRFFSEAARLLPSGGVLAILYNNRQTSQSIMLLEIETYLEGIDASYSRNYRSRDIPAELSQLDDFRDVVRARHVWHRTTSADDLVNYFMSRSMLQPLAAKTGKYKLRQRIGDIADEHAEAGMLRIPFASELDMATRR
jgi:SAM-dependent methyltransferase